MAIKWDYKLACGCNPSYTGKAARLGVTFLILKEGGKYNLTVLSATDRVLSRQTFRTLRQAKDECEAVRIWSRKPSAACRECGCTDDCACPGGCWWVEPDLCSTCATPARQPGAKGARRGRRPSGGAVLAKPSSARTAPGAKQ